MDGTISSHMSGHSEPPPCYNCGMHGHIFTACPEPTRVIPAGLEASRARQQAGGGRSDAEYPNKRHKGPIVTRYSQPPPVQLPTNSFQSAPPGQNYPYASPQPYPPGPPAPYSYQAHHGPNYPLQQPPPPLHGYGLPPHPPGTPSQGQPAFRPHGRPSSGFGPPIPPPAAGHPSPYPAYPPHHAQYPGYPQMPPFAIQAPPPGVHGPPVIPPPNFHPPDFHPPELRTYTGPAPPPPNHSGYTSYDPQYRRAPQTFEQSPSYGDSSRPPYNRHSRDSWSERRKDTPDYHSRDDDRFSRGRPRDEGRHDRDRHDHRRSLDHRKPQRAHGERDSYRNRDRPRSFSRPRSHKSVDSESRARVPAPEVSHPAIHRDAPATLSYSSAMEADVRREEALQPPERDRLINSVQAKVPTEQSSSSGFAYREGRVREPQDNSSIPSRPDDTTVVEEDFLDAFDTAFVGLLPTNQGDAIAEPLPTEYSDQIMLPPAFDAKGVKSKFITPSNLDDFALSIRDTNRWHKYRNHPTFLAPGQVNLANLDLFIAELHKGQNNRHEKRGRGQHTQHNREHGRHQKPHNSDRGGKNKRHMEPSERKRKRDDRMHDPTETEYVHSGNSIHSQQPSRRFRQLSPEPGEISDTPTSSGLTADRTWPPAIPHQDNISSRHAVIATPHSEASSNPISRYDTYGHNESHGHTLPADTRDYRDDSRTSDRDRRPRSPIPYARGQHARNFISPGGEEPEPAAARQARETSERPLLDELQSHIDKVCSSSAATKVPSVPTKLDNQKARIHHPLPPRPPVRIPSPKGSTSSEFEHRAASRPVSRNDAASRPSSPEGVSRDSEPGSPLTRIEAELLGLVGADEEEPASKSPKREPDNAVAFKRKQRKVHSAYDRRW